MAQVELLRLNPDGRVGLELQLVITPLTVGVIVLIVAFLVKV